MTTRFPHVFSPVRIGAVELKNRIFVPAHTTNYGGEHLPSERHVHYHAEKARGGVGLIIFEAIRVHPSSIGRAQGVIGYNPRCVPAFRRVYVGGRSTSGWWTALAPRTALEAIYEGHTAGRLCRRPSGIGRGWAWPRRVAGPNTGSCRAAPGWMLQEARDKASAGCESG